MKAIGYARCQECDQLCAGYAPRGYRPGDALHVWAHTHGASQLGWGRQPKCPGSYKPGRDSRLTSDMEAQ